MIRRKLATLLLGLTLLAMPPAAAQQPDPASGAGSGTLATDDSRLQGVILDIYGDPIPGCRVVARETRSNAAFVSSPSDGEGKYSLALPRDSEYLVIALVAPTGGRVALTNTSPVRIASSVVNQDLHLPLPVAPRPRKGVKQLGGVDRFFLAFVEDPALSGRQHWELQLDGQDFDFARRYGMRGVAAFQFPDLPRIEFGARGGFYGLDIDGASQTESGVTDLELWAKMHMLRTARNRFDLALGVLGTLPTGDEAIGLGTDAMQSKAFVTMSYTLRSAVFVWHVGLRTTQDGSVGGIPLEGRLSPTVGAGLLIPFSSKTSMVVEANYEGERFEEVQPESRVLFGINWRATSLLMLRCAAAAALEDGSPDVQGLAGLAWTF